MMEKVLVLLSVSDQFRALLLSGHERCGQKSAAGHLCHNSSLAQHLWDVATASRRRYAMLCTVHRPATGIYKCTHITSFGVSALTLGVVGDVTCNYRRENPMLDETYFFDGDRSAAKNVVTGEFTSLGTRNFLVCQCDVNDRWLMASGSSSSSPLVLTIAKVSETPMGIVVGIPCSSEVLPPCWIGFNSSNPEQAVTVYLSEANATNMSFTIQVISIQALLRKELAIMSSTKFITPRKYPELQSVLCMRRKTGHNVFILGFRGYVMMVEEPTGAITPLFSAQGELACTSISQLDSRIFLVSSTSAGINKPLQVYIELWDCNDADKPLNVAQQQDGIYQWIAESGLFFKLYKCAITTHNSRHKEGRFRATIEDATTGTAVLSLQFAPSDINVAIHRLLSYIP